MTNSELMDALVSGKPVQIKGQMLCVVGLKPESGVENIHNWIVTTCDRSVSPWVESETWVRTVDESTPCG